MIIEIIKQFLPLMTLLSGVFIVAFILSLAMKKKFVVSFINSNVLLFGLFVALAGTLGSLFYSEIAGYAPCKLCWIQRIFMYPQVLLFGIALWKKDKKVWMYAVPLSVIGGAIAMYHYMLQIGILGKNLPCSSVGYSARCSEQFMLTFGYITIPMMAITAFALIIIFGFMSKYQK